MHWKLYLWDLIDCFLPAVQVTILQSRVSKCWPPTSKLVVHLQKIFLDTTGSFTSAKEY